MIGSARDAVIPRSRIDRTVRALTLVLACLVSSGARAEEAPHVPPHLVSAARTHYEEGVAAYRVGRYQAAVEAFLAADKLAPRAALSFNIARSYDKLGDSARALQYFRDFLRREPAAPNAADTRKRIGELEATLEKRGVQQLSVRSEPPGATLHIDGRLVGSTPWTGELLPGKHLLVLSATNFPEHSREFELDRARAGDLEVVLSRAAAPAPPTAPAPPPRVAVKATHATPAPAPERGHEFGSLPWVVLGTGGAVLITSLGFEIGRRSAEDATENSNHRDYLDNYDRMESRKTVARVLAGVGAAFVAAGGVLLYLDRRSENVARVNCGPERCFGHWEHRF